MFDSDNLLPLALGCWAYVVKALESFSLRYATKKTVKTGLPLTASPEHPSSCKGPSSFEIEASVPILRERRRPTRPSAY